MVEIHDSIIHPQLFLDFLAGDNLTLTFKQHPQDLKHLFSEQNLIIRIGRLNGSQFASIEVEIKGSEPNSTCGKGVHGSRAQNIEEKAGGTRLEIVGINLRVN